MRRTTALALAFCLAPAAVFAQPARPSVEHTPVASAAADEPILVNLQVRRLEGVARVETRWRASASAPWQSVVAERVDDGWRCVIPAQPATVRAVQYHLVLVENGGASRAVFGDETTPHTVVVHPSESARDELWDLTNARGRRVEFSGGGEYTDFGSAPNPNGARCGRAAGEVCVDRFFTAWGMVRYRFHRVVRAVAVRVQRLEGQSTRDGATRDVGLVAADAEVEFRLARPVSLTLRGTLGANEISVQGGGGLQVDIGVGSPTVLSLALSGITSYGLMTAAWLRFETVRDTPMGAGVEVTNQPSGGGAWGVRLLLEVGRHFGRHVTVTLRGGYGARQESAAGFSLGGAATLAF